MDLNRLQDIQRAIARLSSAERAKLAASIRDSSNEEYRIAEPDAAYLAPSQSQFMTVEEYLAFEEQSPVRHEYIDGLVYAMAGASRAHELIVGNTFAAIHAHLRGSPCSSFVGNFKLRLAINRKDIIYYPDIMVACTRDDIERYYLYDPRLIVEVLSPSTQSVDRREKLLNCTQIDSVEEYVLIAQDDCEVIVHRRREKWKSSWLTAPGASVDLESIALAIPMAQIYEGVPFQQAKE